MSGILKRKFEEVDLVGPAPCLSLRGSEDDEVSCSDSGDSGNSSDSLNAPGPSGPLMVPSLQGPRKRLRGRNVHFESVTVYYFNRRQGFTSVPTQGGSTLGMSPRHSWVKRFTLGEFAVEQERSHRDMLREHLKEEKLNAIKLKLTKNGTVSSAEAEALTMDDISEDDLDLDNTEVDEYFFLQPLTTRRRRALLRSSGVRRIDVEEKHELRAIRVSREECGCHCRGMCDPETCACSLAGIKCQVDRMSFPCGCTKDGCSNASGRLEFNPIRVRTHFLHTIMKLELEKSREEEVQSPQQQQLVTNGNGYHGDILPVQQQQQQQHPNLQFPLMNAAPPHSPIMHLPNVSEADLNVEEEEEDEEEEEEEEDTEDDDIENDEEEDEDEMYGDDDNEDGSSLCSGLSDCSTHSLETSDPEDDDDDDDDEGEDEDGNSEEEDDWKSSMDGASRLPLSHTEVVPLSSALGFSNGVYVNLSKSITSDDSLPTKDHNQLDNSSNATFPLLSGKAHTAPSLTTTDSTLPSITACEVPFIDHHFVSTAVSPALPGCSPLGAHDNDSAPAGEADKEQLDTISNNNMTLTGSVQQLGQSVTHRATEQPQQQLFEQHNGSLGDAVQELTLPDRHRDGSQLEKVSIP